MEASMPFRRIVDSEEALRQLYRTPSELVRAKVKTTLDRATQGFIAHSPFVLVATMSDDGNDVSPRGGVRGFVKVLDEGHLAIPDLNGNNLLDSITNIVRTGRIGLLFLVPGHDETVRVNGRAWIVTDDDVLDRFVDEYRRPKAAIGVAVEQVFIHCAKAFRRSSLWDPASWTTGADAPDGLDILQCQGVLPAGPIERLRERFEEGYARDLADDAPEPEPAVD